MNSESFASLIHDALLHLHNRLYLARHPLATMLAKTGDATAGEVLREWLLSGIEQLKPPHHTAHDRPDWRRYRLLGLRYVEGQSLEQVAHALGVSVRQSTRDQQQAIRDLAEALGTLWPHAGPTGDSVGESPAPIEKPQAGSLSAALAELATMGERTSDLAETVDGAISTLGGLATERRVELSSMVADALPPVAVSRPLLRQAVLSLLAYAAEIAPDSRITLAGTDTGRGVTLRVLVQPQKGRPAQPAAGSRGASPATEELLIVAQRLLQSQAGVVEPGDPGIGQPLLTVILPPVQLRSILVVDDNPDLVSLFRRYLRGQPFRVIQATSGATALRLSRSLRPSAIVLDVMMPLQDGWDILQQLRSQDETHATPVIICSVLPERALARSLGVGEFLAKPFTQQALLATLERCLPAAAGHQDLP